MEEEREIYKWRIENFSCWNSVLHGVFITSPVFDRHEYIKRMELVPKDGSIGNMAIYIYSAKDVPSGGNLSVFDGNGSLLSSRQISILIRRALFSLETQFEMIAAQIKKNEPQYKDRLTIKLSFASNKDYVETVSTTFDMLNISMNIDTKLIKSIESDESKCISIIRYNKRNHLDELLLKATHKGGTIEFILHLLTKSVRSVSVESQWSLHKSDNTLVRREENEFLYRNCEPWTFSNSLKMSELVQKGISILLGLKIIDGSINRKILKSFQHISIVSNKTIYFFNEKSSEDTASVTDNQTAESASTLAKDLMCLYQDQKFSDLQLKCDNVSFPVHRTILGARSPVFERLLSSDMKETVSGTVDITDLDVPTLSQFLTFLYTGAVEDIQSESALKLYYAADKYQVSTLKKECSAFLRANVTLSNVCDILSLAYKHQDDELMSSVHGFILDNYSEVLGSEKWRGFVKIEPSLAAETLTDFAAKSYVGKIRPQ